jgi:C4-dicarboxylate transporter DctM subunit
MREAPLGVSNFSGTTGEVTASARRRPVELLDLAIAGIARLCDAALALTMILLIVVLGAGVVSRYVEGSALPWTDEVASYLFVMLTFLGAASGIWRENHPRIEIVLNRLGERGARCVNAIGLGALLSLLLVLVKLGYQSTDQASSISMVSMPLSQGWAYAVVPLSAAIMVIFAIRNFLLKAPGPLEFFLVVTTPATLWSLGYIEVGGMDVYAYVLVALLVSLLIGVPVGFALSITAVLVLNSTDIPLDIVPQRLFDGTSSVILIAIPLFMLTGTLMSSGGMANRLAAFMTSIVGRIRGGLGIADVGASVIFADISGSAVADSAAIGSIMIPQMVRRGYSVEFASALQAAAGSLGLMFPPSSTMIVYAWVAGISISGLFLHSFLPGLLVALSFCIVIYYYAVKWGYPREATGGLRAVITTGYDAFLALLIPVIILVTILGGITTPSEAGVIAVVYTLVVGVVAYRTLKPRELYSLIVEASLNASRVTLIIASATLLSWVIATFQGPQKISALILDISHNPYVVLILLNIFMTVLHIMLEGISTILVLVPVILPVLHQLSIDPIVFGIILAQNSALGLLFPPLGFNLYVISSISGVAVERVATAVIPFIVILAADIVTLIFVPQIATVLPWLVGR